MNRRIITPITILVIFANLIIIHLPVNAQVTYQYALVVISQKEKSQLQIVRPANGSFDVQIQQLPTLDSQQLSPMSIASPDGKWVTLVELVQDSQNVIVHLLHSITGESREITLAILAGEATGFIGSDQKIAWSPDGSYLAFNGRQASDSDLEIFIYSIKDDRLLNLTDDDLNQFHIAWSYDSTQLVTVTDDCVDLTDVSTCVHRLETFDIESASKNAESDLSYLAAGPLATGSNSCEFSWSPDSQRITFASSCNALVSLPHVKEVYVWDLEQGSVNPQTSFTLEAGRRDDASYLGGMYRTAWFDPNTLLIGASYILGPNLPENTETMAYNVADGTSAALFPEMVTEWALNPVSNVIAARLVPPVPAVEDDTAPMDNSTLRLFTLDPTDSFALAWVSEADSLPPGCHLAWSPDGATLAYVTTASSDCADPIQSIVFVDGATGAVQEYVPELGDDVWYTIPIGWIRQ